VGQTFLSAWNLDNVGEMAGIVHRRTLARSARAEHQPEAQQHYAGASVPGWFFNQRAALTRSLA